MSTSHLVLDPDLVPVFIWLHSKKHSEKNLRGPWHYAWEKMGGLVFNPMPYDPRALEHAVHDAIGIPTDDCQCEVCHA